MMDGGGDELGDGGGGVEELVEVVAEAVGVVLHHSPPGLPPMAWT